MKYNKKFTVQEWKTFNKIESGAVLGNDMKFFNFFTKRLESYEYVTRQELLLSRYKIVLTNYRDRKYVKTRYPNDRIRMIKVGVPCPTPFNEKLKMGLKSLPSKMTSENLSKGFKTFDRLMANFEKGMSSFNKGLGGKNDSNFWYSEKSKIDLMSKSSKKLSLSSSKKPFFSEKKTTKKKNRKKEKKESW